MSSLPTIIPPPPETPPVPPPPLLSPSIPPPHILPPPPPLYPLHNQNEKIILHVPTTTPEQVKVGITFEMSRIMNTLPQSPGYKHVAYVCYTKHIQPIIQKGPECGLVAIRMAYEWLFNTPLDGNKLFDIAVSKGYTSQGEMFCTTNMMNLIQDIFKKEVSVVKPSVQTITERFLANDTLLIPYDTDKDFRPALRKGHAAHWALVNGLVFIMRLSQNEFLCSQDEEYNGNIYFLPPQFYSKILDNLKDKCFLRYVLCLQGKSSHMMICDLELLIKSNLNLEEIDPKRSDPTQYVIPEIGISKTLCNTLGVIHFHKGSDIDFQKSIQDR